MQSDEYPEFAVRREQFDAFFPPSLPKSTFYDLVNSGQIAPVKGPKGLYRLNESLRRMGMPMVRRLPNVTEKKPRKVQAHGQTGGERAVAEWAHDPMKNGFKQMQVIQRAMIERMTRSPLEMARVITPAVMVRAASL